MGTSDSVFGFGSEQTRIGLPEGRLDAVSRRRHRALPGGTACLMLHKEVEHLTLDKGVTQRNDTLALMDDRWVGAGTEVAATRMRIVAEGVEIAR